MSIHPHRPLDGADTRSDRSVLNIISVGAGVASLLLPVVGLSAALAEFD